MLCRRHLPNLVFYSSIFLGILYLVRRTSHEQMSTTFSIEHLWNSALITDHRPAEVTLTSTDEKDQLLITIDAPFFNDPAPPSNGSTPGPFPELWNYEVIELFFLASTSRHYLELEFSPHGYYLVLLLTDRRQLLKQLLPVSDYQVERPSVDRWIGRARIPRSLFPGHVDRFNAFAIHGLNASRTYESLYPAPSTSREPDFHRLEDFQPFSIDFGFGENDGADWTTN